MSERVFRAILGSTLLVFLALKLEIGIYIYMGVLLFEGLTNLRVPIIISKLRYKDNYISHVNACGGIETKLRFEAERMLRLVVVVLLIVSYMLLRNVLWFFPWFVGVMLLNAGLTGICPMVMILRWLGFK